MSFDLERTTARVHGMSEGQLLDWLGVALPGMQRHLDAYTRTRDKDHLGELAIAEMTANLVITELMSRAFPSESAEEPPVASAPSGPRTGTSTTSVQKRSWWRRAYGPAPAQQEDTNKEELCT